MKHLTFFSFAIALGGCQGLFPPQPSTLPAEYRGQEYAQASCSSCHAITAGSISSPNPQAPPFPSIVNRDGLTRATLNAWLRDAHNYPSEMTLQVNARRIDDLVTYMLTLRDPKYRPVG